MIKLDQVSLADLLPPNLLSDAKVRAAVQAIDKEQQTITKEASRLSLMSNLDTLDEQWIDELIWQFHVEGAELASTLDEKRNLIRNFIDIHRTKGTRYALERVIDLLGMRAIISEWFEHGGDPYTFRIEVLEVTNKGLSDEKIRLLDRLIMEYKNTRSRLTEIRVFLTSRGDVSHALALIGSEDITVYPIRAEGLTSAGVIRFNAYTADIEYVEVYP
jgi:phage tail P2-like protein